MGNGGALFVRRARGQLHSRDSRRSCARAERRCRRSSEAAASGEPGESSVQATRTQSDGSEDRGLTGRGLHERVRERERERGSVRAREGEGTGVYATAVGVRLSLWQEDGDGFFLCVRARERGKEKQRRERERERENDPRVRGTRRSTCATVSSSTLTK